MWVVSIGLKANPSPPDMSHIMSVCIAANENQLSPHINMVTSSHMAKLVVNIISPSPPPPPPPPPPEGRRSYAGWC